LCHILPTNLGLILMCDSFARNRGDPGDEQQGGELVKHNLDN
jgi:hypothetical protein